MAKDAVLAVQARQGMCADRGRQPGNFKVNDLVLVYKDSLVTPEYRIQPCPKLRPKWYGPFRITERVGPNAFLLDVPSPIRRHPVFNITALRVSIPKTPYLDGLYLRPHQ